MSQIIKTLVSGGPVPPEIPTSFVTEDGTAVPLANVLIVNGNQSDENNDNGITTKGGVIGTGTSNEVDVVLTNRLTGTTNTSDATLTTIITFPLGATPGTFFIDGSVQAFGASGPYGASYGFSGGYITDGATATELGTDYHNEYETSAPASMEAADIFLDTSGNNVILQVQGISASLNWNAVMTYRMVT